MGFLSFLNELLFEEETFFGDLGHLLQNLPLLSAHIPENQRSVKAQLYNNAHTYGAFFFFKYRYIKLFLKKKIIIISPTSQISDVLQWGETIMTRCQFPLFTLPLGPTPVLHPPVPISFGARGVVVISHPNRVFSEAVSKSQADATNAL